MELHMVGDAARLSGNPVAAKIIKKRPMLQTPWCAREMPSADATTAWRVYQSKYRLPDVGAERNTADWFITLYILLDSIGGAPVNLTHQVMSANADPRMIAYLLKTPNTIAWQSMCAHEAAIPYLRAHPDRICSTIYKNPGIFEPIVPPGLIDAILAI
jgi:hypothetical protein